MTTPFEKKIFKNGCIKDKIANKKRNLSTEGVQYEKVIKTNVESAQMMITP